MQVRETIKITKGKLISGSESADIDLAAISTDSRTIKRNDFFLPLKGNNFDGERFVGEAFKRGAIGALVGVRGSGLGVRGKIVIRVRDTTKAMQDIAHAHRMKFKIPVIGITGSNGKTTVKDMITKALSSKFNILSNEGTKNNHIGVPQTLLKLNKSHDICVLEMGTNHKGEIRSLADIARPGITVITNIGPSHLEFLKDLNGVFESKREIFEYLGKGGLAVLNGDDEYLSGIKSRQFRIVRFGFKETNDFRASAITAEKGRIRFLLNEKIEMGLNLIGIHNVYNALAAIAVARNFNLTYRAISKALWQYTPTHMRLNIKSIKGFTVINDAYNSNPSSMSSALETIRDYPAKAKWIVSADMLELGNNKDDFHEVIGELIVRFGFNGLITFGSLSRHTHTRAVACGMPKERAWHCSTRNEVADILRKVLRKGDAVLVKGSRAMRMEEVVEKLRY